MVRVSEIRKLALIGDYLPRKCGIATFTSDLFQAVAGRYPTVDCAVVPVNDIDEGYDYPAEVIVASVRSPIHVLQSALMGAHIATVPFSVLERLYRHPLSDAGIEKFLADHKKIPSTS